MNKNEVEQYLIDFQKRNFEELIDRALKVPPSKKIIAIIGPRRAGKTSYLFQIMQDLIKGGKQKEELIYLNFENTRLFDLNFKEIGEVIKLHNRLFPESKKPILFFDEPQNIGSWERAVRELYDEGYTIYLSGSSSKLLSKEIATSLRGRSLSYLLLPFSFKEFLNLRGIKNSRLISSQEKTNILSLLDEYLEFGGFPEVLIENNKELRLKILESYFDLTIYRDIVERHRIKDSMLVKWLIKTIAANYTKELSIHKVYLTLKSQGRKLSKDDLYLYYSLITDSFFALYLPKFSWSIRKKEPVNKVYLCDIGFAKLIEVSGDIGKKMENIVFLELTRKASPVTEFYYWKNAQQEEVDFVVKEGAKISQLIQISENIEDKNTKERELRALLKASKELECRNLLIITGDYEAEEIIEITNQKATVKFVPLWKWLLDYAKI